MAVLTFLGTGTSGGIPEIGCSCPACSSTDSRDKRTRTSAYLTYKKQHILIDAATDLREQFLREHISKVDHLFLTHAHADHCLGLDDLRAVSFIQQKPIKIYVKKHHLTELHKRFYYIFNEPLQRGGGIVKTETVTITDKIFYPGGLAVTPLKVWHGKLEITGFCFNDKFTYISDASDLPRETLAKISNTRTLVLNALRHRPHATHLCLKQSLALIKKINPKRAYLIHMCHDILHARDSKSLPANVFFAYDGLKLKIDI
ncbi:MAG TPA: MBL fold metallo-hydrolase [Spirochaetota bacterium]|nr:MBL fold metallo-hydrolase [Spirochaetota bacterium]